MYRKLFIFTVIIIIQIFFTHICISQKSQNVINLGKAIELALDRNIQVLQSKNNVESQHSSYQTAIGGLLPSLNASGSFRRSHEWQPETGSSTRFIPGFGTIDLPGTAGYNAKNFYSSSISTNITLFNGFSNYANITRAKSNINSSENLYTRVKQNTIYQTHQLFLNVVRTYQLMKVNEENLKRSLRQLERIEEANRVGSAALADVYRQRTSTGNDELALINAQNNYEKAKADLTLFLSLDETKDYQYDFSDVPTEIDTSEFEILDSKYKDIQPLYKNALQFRPDYQSATNNVYAADASITIARSSLYPTLGASASYSLSDDQFKTQNDNKTLSFGLSVSLPIFSGFQTQNSIEQAKISLNNAEDQLRQTERQIKVEIEKARLDIEAAKKQLKVTKSSVFSAEMDRRIAEEKYNLGAGTLLDLLITNANYINAQSNNVNAVIGYLLAKKQMEFTLGTISN